jgi:hypothetical protein
VSAAVVTSAVIADLAGIERASRTRSCAIISVSGRRTGGNKVMAASDAIFQSTSVEGSGLMTAPNRSGARWGQRRRFEITPPGERRHFRDRIVIPAVDIGRPHRGTT